MSCTGIQSWDEGLPVIRLPSCNHYIKLAFLYAQTVILRFFNAWAEPILHTWVILPIMLLVNNYLKKELSPRCQSNAARNKTKRNVTITFPLRKGGAILYEQILSFLNEYFTYFCVFIFPHIYKSLLIWVKKTGKACLKVLHVHKIQNFTFSLSLGQFNVVKI